MVYVKMVSKVLHWVLLKKQFFFFATYRLGNPVRSSNILISRYYLQLSLARKTTYMIVHVFVQDVSVWGATIREHLIHKYPKGPNVRGGGKLMLR